MKRAAADLWLGLRLALTGGPDARWRAALTATGVAFGVTLLLFAAAVPHIVHAHYHRLAARTPVEHTLDGSGSPRASLLMLGDTTKFDGDSITVQNVQRTGPHPPLPPGLNRLPAPGTMVVSRAVANLFNQPGGAALKQRLRARVVGQIGEAGLSNPRDYYIYRGATGLTKEPDVEVVTAFGTSSQSVFQGPIVTLLVILMAVALLLPIGVFVATASRFGSEQRNVRLAALRLLGADRAGTARIAAGEALLGAAAGVLAGIALFLALRPFTWRVDIAGISVFNQDVSPSIELALLAVLLVPAASVAFALLAMRDVAIEPLGVTRHVTPPRRRLAWRVLAPVAGFALLLPLTRGNNRLIGTGAEIEAATGIVLVLIGVCALLPWCVEAAITRAQGGGSISWLLAVRRLRVDHGTSARVVGAIGLTIAGAIALQTLFSAALTDKNQHFDTNPTRGTVEVSNVLVNRPDAAVFVQKRLQAISGVRSTTAAATMAPNSPAPITVAPCATLVQLLDTHGCGPNSVFISSGYPDAQLAAGHPLKLPDTTITVPAEAKRVGLNPKTFSGPFIASVPVGALLLTPQSAARLGLKPTVVDAVVKLNLKRRGAEGRLRNTVAKLDPLASVDDVIDDPTNPLLDSMQHALVAGAVAVLLVIGGSLLVAAAEQLRERRRVLAVLAAFGTRRSTLATSVLWQTALPVGMGLVLALAIGTALAAVLMKIVDLPVTFDWTAILIQIGAGLAVVAGVTGLMLPLLWRQTRAEALRAE